MPSHLFGDGNIKYLEKPPVSIQDKNNPLGVFNIYGSEAHLPSLGKRCT